MASEDRTTPTDLDAEARAANADTAQPPSCGERGGGERHAPSDVEGALRSQPWSFDFFQAVRRIECAHPKLPRIGTSARPGDDPVRFAQLPSLAFAPSTVAAYTPALDGRAPRLAGYFFGMLGPNGALPSHLTEYAIERTHHHHDPTFARFLDVFHHRMIASFYRAWSLSRPAVSFDRPAPQTDWFGRYLASLCGLGFASLRERDGMPDRAKLYYAGLLAGQTKHPAGLRAMLADFFGIGVAIREFIGEWVRIPEPSRWRLSAGASADFGLLGHSVLLGACVWGAQHRFRLVFGPLRLDDYCRFLPGKPSLARVVAFVRNAIGDEKAWDLNLVLCRGDVPALCLNGAAQLGWTTWLPAPRVERDPDDLILEPMTR